MSEETRLTKRKSVVSYRSSFARDLISVSTVRPSPRDMAREMQRSVRICVYACVCVCAVLKAHHDRLQQQRSRGEVHDGGSLLSGAWTHLSLEQRWQTQILLKPQHYFWEVLEEL